MQFIYYSMISQILFLVEKNDCLIDCLKIYIILLTLNGQLVTGFCMWSLTLAWFVVFDGSFIQERSVCLSFKRMILEDKEGLEIQNCG